MKNRALKYTLGFAAIGIIITVLVFYVQRSTLKTYQRNLPYLSLGDKIKNSTTLGHLSMEEAIGGDKSVDFERDVMNRFITSRDLLQAAYDGKESALGSFQKSDDEDVKALLKTSIFDIEKLIQGARDRWEARSQTTAAPAVTVPVATVPDVMINDDSTMTSMPEPEVMQQPIVHLDAAGGKLDQAFDTAFDDFQTTLDKLTEHFQNAVQRDTTYLNSISWVSIALMAAAFVILCVLLFRLQHGNDVMSSENQVRLQEQQGAVGQLSNFIEAVSSGDFSVDLTLGGDADDLSNKLINMRDKLKENADNEKKRSYSTLGLAQVGEILRTTTTQASELYDNIVRFLVKYTKSNQGGLFIINEDEEHHVVLDLMACYAFERKKFLTKQVEPGEGLVGQCFLEGERIYLKEVPPEYVSITSGLGGAKPKSLLLVPMKLNDKIYGVIELATFTTYQDFELELVEKLAESIASTISTVRVNDSTRLLLEKTQEQAEQMKAQEEEIRQNMEELEATQEEMRRKQTVLEKELMQSQQQAIALQQQEKQLTESQDTLQAIVDNIPRAIFWKDKDLRFMGCNRIFAAVAGVSSYHEMLGKTDYDMSWKAHAEAYRADDFEVMRSRKSKMDIEEVNVDSEGLESWLLTSKVPIINHENEVVAILGMFENITERKRNDADINKKLIERDQALSEIQQLKRLLESKG